jgi:hypothetical protein
MTIILTPNEHNIVKAKFEGHELLHFGMPSDAVVWRKQFTSFHLFHLFRLGEGNMNGYRSLSAMAAVFLACLFLAGAAYAQSPTVTTDKEDYAPGETVIVTGAGWLSGETVQLVFDETPQIHEPDTLYATADASGNIYNNEYVIQDHDLGQTFILTATGLTSGWTAETRFTDATLAFSATIIPTCVTTSTSNSYSITVTNNSIGPGATELGSGRIQIPTGYTGIPAPGTTLTYSASSGKSWNVRIGTTPNTDKILFSANTPASTNNLAIGESITITITVTSPSTVGSYEWTVTAFRGANFSTGPYPAPSSQPTVDVNSSLTITAPTAINTTTGTGATSCGKVISDATLGTATTSGGCSPVNVTRSEVPAGNLFPVGITTITYTATDASGNTAMATQTVTVTDNTPPAPNVASLPTVTGQCSATITSAPTATDNCVGTVTGTTSDPLTYSSQGTFMVTWTYDDGHGNTSTQTQTVIVQDTQAPVADVASLTTVTGQCSATITSAPTATDNCMGTITGTTSDPLTYSSQGTFTVMWTYDDGHGNTSTQTQTVIVQDNLAPVADVASLPTVTGQCSATISSAPTATDDCVGTIIGTTSDPLTYTTQGTFAVHWTYNDGNGNTSTQDQTVIVDDTTPPTISCPADIVTAAAAGASTAAVSYTVTANDNCGSPTIVSNPQSGDPFPVGMTTVNATATDVGGNTASCSFTVTVKSTPTVTVEAASVQYSDQVTLSATVTAVPFPDQTLTGTVEFFISGSSVGSAPIPSGGGVASLTVTIINAPGNYSVTAQFTSTNPYYTDNSGGPVTLTVTKEDARAYYTGALFVSSNSSGAATVTLAATIKDITAETGDPDYDAYAGDIRNAKVTFINRDNNSTIAANVPVGLADPSDTKVGTATYNWDVNIGSANSVSYTIGIIVNNYYTRNSGADDEVITVSKPLNDFITGGGYLVMSNSSGEYPGAAGTKNNFGFNVKYNKSGKNLQGNINSIVRNGDRVYQIKGNAMTSLSVNGTAKMAIFNGKANIQDITDPNNVIPIDGNATLQVTMTDNGEPGSSDKIGITVWNKSGGLWFSSNWNGTQTVEQTLSGGNLVVHGGSVGKAAGADLESEVDFIPTEYALFQNYPNPFNPATQIQFDLPEDSRVKILIFDILGRVVMTLLNEELPAGRYRKLWNGQDQFGRVLPSGIYFFRIDAKSASSDRRLNVVKRMMFVK